MNKKNNKKGFTLAELLIVVAIIAVLVAIAIPIFTSQLEKSREATDTSNVRSAVAEVTTEYLSDSKAHSMTVTARQARSGWQNSANGKIVMQISGKESSKSFKAVKAPGKYKVNINTSGTVSVE